jgi:hypothetical protein
VLWDNQRVPASVDEGCLVLALLEWTCNCKVMEACLGRDAAVLLGGCAIRSSCDPPCSMPTLGSGALYFFGLQHADEVHAILFGVGCLCMAYGLT